MHKNCMYCFQDHKQLYSDITLPVTLFLHPSGMLLSFSRQERRWETKTFVTVSQTAKKHAAATAFHKEAHTAVAAENSA